MTEKIIVKQGKPWKNDSSHKTYEEADIVRQKLLKAWQNKEEHEGMQVKVRRLHSPERYVVKIRRHPDIAEQEKSKKHGKSRKRNKKDTDGRKFDASTSI